MQHLGKLSAENKHISCFSIFDFNLFPVLNRKDDFLEPLHKFVLIHYRME